MGSACSLSRGGTAATPTPLRLAEVVQAGLPAFVRTRRLPAHHWKVLNAILACRSPLLGGHQYECALCCCGHFAPHGCGNRHCPTCQGINSRHWLDVQATRVLPIPYFHLVFTLPHVLNPLIQQNQAALYDLLFTTATDTLLSFGRNNLGAQLGITAVLHTWSQTLLDHYHLHCIVSGGGISLDRLRWVHSQPDYLFNVGALSEVFRARFCEGLQGLYAGGRLRFHGQLAPLAVTAPFQALVRKACDKGWVVYSKRPFAGPQQVLTYLSRYTHRVGLSNRRLLHLDRAGGTVTFDYKDYADGARHKSMRLDLPEFLRRLCLHFLPPRFVKIRHFGLLANRRRQDRLKLARLLLAAEPAPGPPVPRIELPPPAEPRPWPVCPHCGRAALILVRVVPPQRFKPAVPAQDTS